MPKKFPVGRRPVIVDVGCYCRSVKSPPFISPISLPPKPTKPSSSQSHPLPFSSSSPITTTTITTVASHISKIATRLPEKSTSRRRKKKKKKKKEWKVGDCTAVVVESSDPFSDFKESMLLMIEGQDIWRWEDLKQLLHRFLTLNSPHHHPSIVRAFSEVCHAIYAPPSPPSSSPAPAIMPRDVREKGRKIK